MADSLISEREGGGIVPLNIPESILLPWKPRAEARCLGSKALVAATNAF